MTCICIWSESKLSLCVSVQLPRTAALCQQRARKLSVSQKREKEKQQHSSSHIVVLCGFSVFFRCTVVFPFIGKTTPSSETSERAPSAKRDSLSSGEKNSSDSKATQVATRLHAHFFFYFFFLNEAHL